LGGIGIVGLVLIIVIVVVVFARRWWGPPPRWRRLTSRSSVGS